MRNSKRKVSTTVYITLDQERLLKKLNERTKVPIAQYIREGIDLVLTRHKNALPGQLSFVHDDLPGAKS